MTFEVAIRFTVELRDTPRTLTWGWHCVSPLPCWSQQKDGRRISRWYLLRLVVPPEVLQEWRDAPREGGPVYGPKGAWGSPQGPGAAPGGEGQAAGDSVLTGGEAEPLHQHTPRDAPPGGSLGGLRGRGDGFINSKTEGAA